jgi:hypothetical protein
VAERRALGRAGRRLAVEVGERGTRGVVARLERHRHLVQRLREREHDEVHQLEEQLVGRALDVTGIVAGIAAAHVAAEIVVDRVAHERLISGDRVRSMALVTRCGSWLS